MSTKDTAEEKYGLIVEDVSHFPRGSLHRGAEKIEVIYPNTVTKMVKRFHDTSGIDNVGTAKWDSPESSISVDLIIEEYVEFLEAVCERDAVATLDALCDLVYVAVGMAVRFGWDFDEAFKRVHHSNMTKIINGTVLREDGKILKSRDYRPPKLGDLV